MSTLLDDEKVFDFSEVMSGSEPEEKLSGTRSATTAPRRGRPPGKRMEKRLQELQEKLSGEMFQVGALVSLPLSTTGTYICQESDATTKAIVELAASRKEWIEALERISQLQPGLVIGRTALGIGASIAVDRERLDPDKTFLRFLGVYEAWKRVQDKRPPGPAEGSSYQPPPAQFVPVS